jgi:glycosyltransferase involved in cell wall biosynthesis
LEGDGRQGRGVKVALLTSDRERCGIARYSRDLYAALAPLVEVDLVPIHPWPPEGERLERLRAADIVHLQHEYSFWGTAFPPPRAYYEGLERFRRPGRFLITAHTVADAEMVVAAQGWGAKALVKRVALRLPAGLRGEIEAGPFRVADRVIVHNLVAAGALAKRLDRTDRVRFWPMPVPEWSTPASKWGPLSQQFGFHGRRLVTIFGFVSSEKEYGLALRAIGRIRKENPEPLLVIAGAPRDERMRAFVIFLQEAERRRGAAGERFSEPRSPLSAFGIRLGPTESEMARVLTPSYRLTGYLADADARAILEQTDVALLPYRSATGSYAAGAAMAAACPLLTSDLPAFAEPLPALRYRVGDVQDLTEKLNHLLADDLARTALIARSRRFAQENSWARAAEHHAGLYRELDEAAG